MTYDIITVTTLTGDVPLTTYNDSLTEADILNAPTLTVKDEFGIVHLPTNEALRYSETDPVTFPTRADAQKFMDELEMYGDSAGQPPKITKLPQ